MKKGLFFVIVLFFSTILFSSCASYPQAEYDATVAVVNETKAAGADVYVPEAYKSLADSLQKAEIKLNQEKSKWFKTYKESKTYLLGVTSFAKDVKAKNEFRKAELVKESTTGGVFGIVKEKDGYYVKSGLNESSLDYIGGMFMKNKNKFNSYAEALKRLEYIKGQEDIQLQEATKYILKQNKPQAPAPQAEAPVAEPSMDTPPAPPAPAAVCTLAPAKVLW